MNIKNVSPIMQRMLATFIVFTRFQLDDMKQLPNEVIIISFDDDENSIKR